MFHPVNSSPLFRLPSACPFVTDAEPIVSTTDIRIIAHQLIDAFYTCKYSIKQRNELPPVIRYLVEQLQPQLQANPADPQLVYLTAVLQIIYICLTQLHFHFDCPCPTTFRDQPYKKHNFYDHLYQLALAVYPLLRPKFVADFSTMSDEYRLLFLLMYTSGSPNFVTDVIPQQRLLIASFLCSIIMTLTPLTFHIKFEYPLPWHSSLEELVVNKLPSLQQDALYIRYVNYAYSENVMHLVGLFPYRGEPKCLNNFDLSGCWSRRAYLTQSMVNCNLRQSTWLSPSLNEDFLRNPVPLPSEHPIGESMPPSFSIFKNNSCFFEFEVPASQTPTLPAKKRSSRYMPNWLSACYGLKS